MANREAYFGSRQLLFSRSLTRLLGGLAAFNAHYLVRGQQHNRAAVASESNVTYLTGDSHGYLFPFGTNGR